MGRQKIRKIKRKIKYDPIPQAYVITMPRTQKLRRNQYKCALCGEVYIKGWTDAEATAELNSHFPGLPVEETGLVCEPCYIKLRKAFHG